MDADRFAAARHAFTTAPSRRAALRAVSGLSLASLLGLNETSAKRKHKKKPACPTCPTFQECPSCQECPTCPPPPSPPPLPYCAGKNYCAGGPPASYECQASGSACFCWVRGDTAHLGEPFCGQGVGATPPANCSACPGGTVCVLLGGICAGGLGCAPPCPNPL